jgi:hypothetical protein
MIRFAGKNLLLSAREQAFKAISVWSLKVHILLISDFSWVILGSCRIFLFNRSTVSTSIALGK